MCGMEDAVAPANSQVHEENIAEGGGWQKKSFGNEGECSSITIDWEEFIGIERPL